MDPRGPGPPDRRLALAAAGVALFALLQYVVEAQGRLAGLPLGLGLALVAWLGHAIAPVLAVTAVVVRLTQASSTEPFLVTLFGGVLLLCQLSLSWEGYHRVCRGSRRLNDPVSATLFLVLVPGLLAGIFAALKALLAGRGLLDDGVRIWINDAVGILALTPPLLAMLTPDLVSLGLAASEAKKSGRTTHTIWSLGQLLEISVLAVSTGILGLIVAASHSRAQPQLVWQFSGLSLLLIVWSALRQGLPGGTLAAASAAILTLIGIDDASTTIQGNLLAQCSTALLVGASAGWIRASEARYRQVVGHIPVMLYSARVHAPAKAVVGDQGKKQPHRISPEFLASIEITLVSAASRKVFKCEPEELEGPFSSWLDHVMPVDREVVIAALAQMQIEKKPVVCEYRVGEEPPAEQPLDMTPITKLTQLIAAAARHDRWVRDTLAPKYSPEGELEGWEGVVEDITETRELAQQVRRTTGMLQALVASLPAGIFFVHGGLGLPVLVNARARQLLGQKEDLAAGVAHLTEVYRFHKPTGEPYPAEELPITRALKHGEACMADDVVVHRIDGKKVRLVTWAAPVDLGRGIHDAAVWVLEDMSKLKQSELKETPATADVKT